VQLLKKLFNVFQDFYDNIIAKADVLQVKGNAICIFQDLQCLTPRYTEKVQLKFCFLLHIMISTINVEAPNLTKKKMQLYVCSNVYYRLHLFYITLKD